MKKCCIVLLALAAGTMLFAQKVGLVLSGGGAKGIIHIGVIKALEENNIPIDYVAGTSMGAIVSSMYAMGMTPDEMITLLKSDDFKHWSTGEIETDYKYYYLNPDPRPYLAEIPFRVILSDSIKIKSKILPTNLVSPNQMNFAFVPLFAQANAACRGDFNKLFVPFRCVASDVYRKEPVVFRTGVLGDAVRASMSFPFMYKPIKINGRLLFDGGIYNNFPVDVMQTDFSPEYIIGSAVADNPQKPEDTDIVTQVQNMIINRTNYSINEKDGILLDFKHNNINLFDFSKVDELVKLGYDSTMKKISYMKMRIKREKTATQVDQARQEFRKSFPALKYQRVVVTGVDSLQKSYVENYFHGRNEIFDQTEFKESYFRLIADDKIKEVLPHAEYNSANGNFNLNLDVKVQSQLKLLIGGNISSSTSNEGYFGLSYQNLNEFAQTAILDAQFGKVYNGLGFSSRMDMPSQNHWYIKMNVVLHKMDYYSGDVIFYNDFRLSNMTQFEAYGKASVGFPITMRGRIEIGAGYGALTDRYLQNSNALVATNQKDKSFFSLGNIFTRIETNTYDTRMYPTKGYYATASVQCLGGTQSFRSYSNPSSNVTNLRDYWLHINASMAKYYKISPFFTLGAYTELVISNRNLLNNYTVSVMQAPAFRPTPHSSVNFNPAFSANQYLALGVKPIYVINDQLHLRTEWYLFQPYKCIQTPDKLTAVYSKPFQHTYLMTEWTAVYNFKIASAGIFTNYYSTGPSKWNFGLNIGFLLFNKRFIE